MADLVSLGEMMLCLSPPKYERLRRASSLDVRICGAQFNVAANMASLGYSSLFLSALPQNEMGQLAHSLGAGYGVDMSQIKWVPGARMGLIFIEYGVSPRSHKHVYDRVQSAASTLAPDDFDFDAALDGARIAYADGILAALNPGCQAATLAYLQAARKAGVKICFDVNYRSTLWEMEAAREFYQKALPLADILVTNRNFSEELLDFSGSDTEIMQAYRHLYNCEVVCITYRNMEGMLRGAWHSLALAGEQVYEGRKMSFDVVDRFGTGDAFLAGLLHGYLKGDIQYGLDFGDAYCALAHTTDGNPAVFTQQEVDEILDEGYQVITKR